MSIYDVDLDRYSLRTERSCVKILRNMAISFAILNFKNSFLVLKSGTVVDGYIYIS